MSEVHKKNLFEYRSQLSLRRMDLLADLKEVEKILAAVDKEIDSLYSTSTK